MQGQLEQSRLNSSLLEIQQQQSQAEARVSGSAEADRVSCFLSGLQNQVPELDDRMDMWKVLRKTEALSVVSQGGAQIYFTPKDVDLSIESRSGATASPTPAPKSCPNAADTS